MPHIGSIYRYPIKSMSGQELRSASLADNYGLPGDRAYAFLQRDVSFDAAAPEHYGKRHFLNLMEHERMAEFDARFDDAGTYLTLIHRGEPIFEGDLDDGENRRRLSEIFAHAFRREAVHPPRMLAAPRHMFTDIREDGLSVLNLESIRALGRAAGVTLDPLRFRANIYLEGLAPWAERLWEKDQVVTLGDVPTRVLKAIGRCQAISVDPTTGKRDLDLPRVLAGSFERNVMGVYVMVCGDGVIAAGDPVKIECGDVRQE